MSIEDYSGYKAAVLFWKIIPPFLILLGTAGNSLTIIVLLQRRLRNGPTSVFLISLAVSDILALTTGLLRQWIKYTFDLDIREDLTKLGCKFHWFIVYFVTQFSSWMLICVTTERVISTLLPHKRRIFCKRNNAYMVIIIIVCFLFILNSHYLFGYGDISSVDGNGTEIDRCLPVTEKYDHFIVYTWTWIDLCVFYLTPMLVLLIGNSLIVYKVIQSHRRSRQAVAPTNSETIKSNQQKTSSLTIMLFLVSILFIVCITPIVVYPIGDPYWKQDASDQRLASLFLIETLANLFMYVNHSVNFVLYFMSGTKFRNEVKKLVCRRKIAPAPNEMRTTLSRSGL